MAKLTQKILGKVSGSLGDLTFRQRNGKNYLASRPESFIPGTDEASITRREKFGFSVKLASLINSDDRLKSIWSKQTPQGKYSYNYIVQMNYPTITANSVTNSTKLVPNNGFYTSVSSLNFNSNNIELVINPLGLESGIDTSVEKNIQLVSLISLSEPQSEQVEKSYLIMLNSQTQPITLDNELTFTIPISNQNQNIINKYNSKTTLFTLLTLDETNSVYNFSDTFTG